MFDDKVWYFYCICFVSIINKSAADNIYDQSIFKERIALDLYENPKNGSIAVATKIAELIKKKQAQNKHCIIGLATGSSPISIYEELVRLHKDEGLSFNNVITFNLDEYVPMDPNSIHSYYKFMYENLFNHIDINKKNISLFIKKMKLFLKLKLGSVKKTKLKQSLVRLWKA